MRLRAAPEAANAWERKSVGYRVEEARPVVSCDVEQRLHLGMSAAFAAGFEHEEGRAIVGRQFERRGESALTSSPMRFAHVAAPASYAASSRRSQARAMAHSRLTEASEMPATLRGLFERQAAEVAQLDDTALRRVDL